MQHTFRGEERTLGEGSACLVAPYEQHQFYHTDGSPIHFNISIPAANFKNLCDAIDPKVYSSLLDGRRICRMNDREFDYFKQLSEIALASEGSRARLVVKTIILNIINCLVDIETEDERRPEWFIRFMERLRSSEYFLKPIGELYALVPYSQPILNSTFKQAMGETLISYLTKMRISYAANLLSFSFQPHLQENNGLYPLGVQKKA